MWFVIYVVMWCDDSPHSIIEGFFLGWRHLWYLLHSALALALLWFLRDKPKTLLILSVVFALCGLAIQYGVAYGLLHVHLHAGRNALFFCFPFIYTGYVINKYRIYERKFNLPLLLTLGFCVLMLEVILNYKLSEADLDILAGLYVVAPSLFVAVLKKKARSDNKTLAYYSTGIYLTHILFLNVGENFLGLSPTQNVIFALTVSLVATWPLIRWNRKVKYLL